METHRCASCFCMLDAPVCPNCGYPRTVKNESHQLPVGTMLRERYQIGRVLGQGGFGITYLGWDTLLESKVAIKEFYPGSMVNRDSSVNHAVSCNTAVMAGHYHATLERFLREAKALAKFRSIPEIVDIQDFFEENNTAYIVMEYVQGMNLAAYVQKNGGKIPVDETFRILRPVMEALATVHKAGLVHRDISPDNIMLHPMGGAKLLDFGAVRSVENAAVDKELTQSTEAILKHGFAPIEQYNSKGSLGPWTDEYAMCATVYYCLTGCIPENAPARVAEGTDPGWAIILGLTSEQRAVLEKGMSVRARDRYPDMDALIRNLFPAEKPLPQIREPESKTEVRTVKKAPPAAERRISAEKSSAEGRSMRIALLSLCVLLVAGVAAMLLLNTTLLMKISRGKETNPDKQPSAETSSMAQLAQEYLERAELLALGYDYDGAIAVLDEFPGEEPPAMTAKREEYRESKGKLKEWTDYSSIANLAFHVLIADPARAFADKDLGGQYNKNFVTIDEFSRILEQLYAGGYVLVDFDSFTGTDGGGSFHTEPIRLPDGRKPIMITETMVNYFDYMVDSNKDSEPDAGGDGFAYRLIVDENGDIKAQMVDSAGQTRTGNYDLVPILEDFIKEHPDFSYQGARAILAVCGYEGVFGYRINSVKMDEVLAIRNTPEMSGTIIGYLQIGDKVDILREDQSEGLQWWLIREGWICGEYLKQYISSDGRIMNNSSPTDSSSIVLAQELVKALREKGYTIACNTFGNVAYGDKSAAQIRADLQDWTSQITPVIGEADVMVFARTSDIGDYSGAKFGVLCDFGFRYFISHGSAPSAEVNSSFVRQSRLMVTGENMVWHSDQFAEYFDSTAVLNDLRGNVPKS